MTELDTATRETIEQGIERILSRIIGHVLAHVVRDVAVDMDMFLSMNYPTAYVQSVSIGADQSVDVMVDYAGRLYEGRLIAGKTEVVKRSPSVNMPNPL